MCETCAISPPCSMHAPMAGHHQLASKLTCVQCSTMHMKSAKCKRVSSSTAFCNAMYNVYHVEHAHQLDWGHTVAGVEDLHASPLEQWLSAGSLKCLIQTPRQPHATAAIHLPLLLVITKYRTLLCHIRVQTATKHRRQGHGSALVL